MTEPLYEPCPECGLPIVDRDNDLHTVNDHQAASHDVDAGEYHEDCCPCCAAGEHNHELLDELAP